MTGVAPGRLGNAHPNIVPYETFETADGEIAVAVGSERQWPRLCEALGLPAPRRSTRASRRTATASNAARSCARSWPSGSSSGRRAEWLSILEAAEIPAGPINDVLAAFASPEAVARAMTVELEHPAWGVIRQVGCPFELSATPASIRTPPPLLGQRHRRDPRRSSATTRPTIRALRDARVV